MSSTFLIISLVLSNLLLIPQLKSVCYMFQPWIFILFCFIVFNSLLIFKILPSASLKYVIYMIHSSPQLITSISGSLLSLYLLFIFLSFGAFDLVSSCATGYFLEYLTLSAKIVEVVLGSEYYYVPSEKINSVFERQLGWAKITSN